MDQFLAFAAKNWLLFAAFFAILATLITTEILRLMRGVRSIDPQQAVRLLNDDEATMVDVRDPAEFRAGHITDARNLPVKEFDRRISELDRYRERTVIVCCQSGARSQSVATKLKKAGFAKVANLSGGMQSWTSANLPVVRK